MKTKKQIAREIREGKSTAIFMVDSFKDDEKIKLLNTEKITKSEFIEQILPNDPYEVIELYEGKYQVMKKGLFLPIESHLSMEKIQAIDLYYDSIVRIYPELKDFVKHARGKISIGCSNCNKNAFNFKIIQGIKILGGLNRDVEELVPIFSRQFIDKLKELKPDKTMSLDLALYGIQPENKVKINKPVIPQNKAISKPVIDINPIIEPKHTIEHNWIRSQCLLCVGKHIATALCLYKEYLSDMEKYFDYRWESIGELVCAEHECINIDFELANKIRLTRLKIMEDKAYIPDLNRFFKLIDK